MVTPSGTASSGNSSPSAISVPGGGPSSKSAAGSEEATNAASNAAVRSLPSENPCAIRWTAFQKQVMSAIPPVHVATIPTNESVVRGAWRQGCSRCSGRDGWAGQGAVGGWGEAGLPRGEPRGQPPRIIVSVQADIRKRAGDAFLAAASRPRCNAADCRPSATLRTGAGATTSDRCCRCMETTNAPRGQATRLAAQRCHWS